MATSINYEIASPRLAGTVTAQTDPLTGVIENLSTGDASLGVPAKTGFSVAILGDSLIRNNQWDGAASTTKFNSQLGFWSFAQVLTKKRFSFSPSLNFGVFGDTTAQVLARVGTVTAANPNVVIVMAGTNDLAADVSAADIVLNLRKIYAALTKAGATVVACTLWPRSDAGMTAARSKVLHQANQQLRALVPTMQNVVLWDGYAVLADQTSTVSGCLAALFADNLHPNRTGAFWAGKSLAAVLDAAFPAVAVPKYACVSGSDLYDATTAPQGNKLTNAMLSGTGGTNAGAYATGSVATGWTVYRASGTTITCAATKGTVTLVNGQTYATQILTVSSPGGGAATEEISFFQDITTTSGDVLVCGCDIDVASISGRLNYVTPQLQAQYGSFTVLSRDCYYASGGAASIPAAFAGHTCTVDGTAPAGGTTTRASVVIGLDCTVASSVVVTIALPYARKI